jgi:hypothetical protein
MLKQQAVKEKAEKTAFYIQKQKENSGGTIFLFPFLSSCLLLYEVLFFTVCLFYWTCLFSRQLF